MVLREMRMLELEARSARSAKTIAGLVVMQHFRVLNRFPQHPDDTTSKEPEILDSRYNTPTLCPMPYNPTGLPRSKSHVVGYRGIRKIGTGESRIVRSISDREEITRPEKLRSSQARLPRNAV
jgi:hypothetical protein